MFTCALFQEKDSALELLLVSKGALFLLPAICIRRNRGETKQEYRPSFSVDFV